MSQKTILRLFVIIASAVEIQVFTGIITSEFFFKFSDWIAISRASVPFARATVYLDFVNLEKFFSKLLTSSPPTKLAVRINLFIFSKIFFFQV